MFLVADLPLPTLAREYWSGNYHVFLLEPGRLRIGADCCDACHHQTQRDDWGKRQTKYLSYFHASYSVPLCFVTMARSRDFVMPLKSIDRSLFRVSTSKARTGFSLKQRRVQRLMSAHSRSATDG
jgi:hypothetical protein